MTVVQVNGDDEINKESPELERLDNLYKRAREDLRKHLAMDPRKAFDVSYFFGNMVIVVKKEGTTAGELNPTQTITNHNKGEQ